MGASASDKWSPIGANGSGSGVINPPDDERPRVEQIAIYNISPTPQEPILYIF